MSDDRSMSVKAYLDVGGGRQEVRRFGLPEGIATNFSCLKERVRSVFGLGQKDITLSWKDSEGDLIVISSDEELVEAIADSLSKQKLQLFKVNVTVGTRPDLGPNNSLPGSQQGALHEGVVCDGCHGLVRGYRYRCLSCKDFDLCAACEFKGKHSEHRMIRMPKPEQKGAPNFWWKEHHGPPGHFSTHFGMNSDNGGGFTSTSSTGGAPGMASASASFGTGWGGPGGRRFRRGCGGRGRGWWGGWWPGSGGNGFGGCGQAQSQANSGQQQQQQSQSQGPTHTQSQGQTHTQSQTCSQSQCQSQNGNQQTERNEGNNKDNGCPWTSTSTDQCPYMDMEHEGPNPQQVAEEAQQMAEEVAQQAHRFASQMASEHVANVMRGIWTAWTGGQQNSGATGGATHTFSSSSSSSSSTSTNGDKQQKEQKDSSAGTEYLKNVGETVATILDPLGIDVEVSVEHNGIRQRCSLGSDKAASNQDASAPTQEVPSKSPTPDSESVGSGRRINIDVQTENSGPSSRTSTADENMEVTSPPEQMEAEQAASDTEDWTLVNKDAAQDTRQTAASSERRVEYPNLAEVAPHPDPVIQNAIDQMQSMGYNNEGGWLTRLLENKGGDINQVLDIIQPMNK